MEPRTARIGDIIDAARISPYQVGILVLCFVTVLVDGFDTALIGYIAPALRQEWGLKPAQLAPAFGAGLFGLMAGSLLFGPIADRFGRKRVLLLSVATFGLASLATAYTHSIEALTAMRFVTGIGLGGAMPTCITLSSEFSPARRRMILVTLSWSGFTAGLALGGLISAHVIPTYGWRGMLILGGAVPLLMLPLMAWMMPESVRFLASDPRHAERLRRIVERITGTSWQGTAIVDDSTTAQRKSPVSQLFVDGRAVGTLLLWAAFFCSLFVFYLLTSWLPSILKDAGYDIARAARIGAMVPLGGTVGAIVLALLSSRIGAYRLLAAAYLGAAAVIAISGQLIARPDAFALAVFLIGFGVAGAQNGLNIIAATLYPTAARVTGVSWAMANGRFGSIVGSMTGAWMIAAAGSPPTFFRWLAVPMIVATLALLALYLSSEGRPTKLASAAPA